MRNSKLQLLVFAFLALVLSSCAAPSSWSQWRHDAQGTGVATGETAITAANAGSMVLDYEIDLGDQGPGAAQVSVANNRAFVADADGLAVYDATGVSGCAAGTPKTCAPLWTATVPGATFYLASPSIVGSIVYVSGGWGTGPNTSTRIAAFDASGTNGCGGTPKVCSPLWQTTVGDGLFSQIVANGFVYSEADDKLVAYDAAGVNGCTGAPKTCSPVWTSSVSVPFARIVTDGQTLVAVPNAGFKFYAFDPLGQLGCSGPPVVCAPLWQADYNTGSYAFPTIAGGKVYVPEYAISTIWVYDEAGQSGCAGTPVVCQPLWRTHGNASYGYAVTVTNGTAITATEAFDATGNQNCSGVPKVCTPIWTMGGPSRWPLVANGVIFSTGRAYDLSACPTGCSPLAGWSHDDDERAIAGGRVFSIKSAASPAHEILRVYRLP